jgi:hypothetical protein
LKLCISAEEGSFHIKHSYEGIILDAFRPFVSDIKKYGLHSLRPGGVTTAADWIMPFLTVCKRQIRLKRFIKRQVNWFRKYRFMT